MNVQEDLLLAPRGAEAVGFQGAEEGGFGWWHGGCGCEEVMGCSSMIVSIPSTWGTRARGRKMVAKIFDLPRHCLRIRTPLAPVQVL